MALALELIGVGMPPAQARRLGGDNNLTVAAAASTTATGATALTASNSLITTSGASTNSVLLPSAERGAMFMVQVASGQTTVNIYPQAGETIIDEGAQGAAGAVATLAASKAALFISAGTVWWMLRGA